MLILLLTLFFILSIAIVSAVDTDLSDDSMSSYNKCVNYKEINHQPIKYHAINELNYKNPSVSKDFDFFGLFNFFGQEKNMDTGYGLVTCIMLILINYQTMELILYF